RECRRSFSVLGPRAVHNEVDRTAQCRFGPVRHNRLTAHQIFPTTIWSVNLPDLAPHLEEWKRALDAKMAEEKEGVGRSTRGGWSGPKTLFAEERFKPLAVAAQTHFGKCLVAMGMPAGFRFGLEAWGNIHEQGGYNKLHIHREAILSGVFYLSRPGDSGAIVFHDPRPGTLFSRPFGLGVNKWSEIRMSPPTGAMLMFPNWMEHSVEPNQSQERRYSIAINAIFPSRR
ncbi:MAG TPA: TIGR02466 family protein, partial [Croceibacterium sp.]|nr:TIGR02466 family protein [Croceibacterium sp.]